MSSITVCPSPGQWGTIERTMLERAGIKGQKTSACEPFIHPSFFYNFSGKDRNLPAGAFMSDLIGFQKDLSRKYSFHHSLIK
jgi:hypothetical protein